MNEQSALRIAIVNDALAERNGVGTYYVDLAEHLRDRIETVEMICPSTTEQPPHQWYTLPLLGDPSQRVGVPHPLRLWRAIKQVDPDVLIVPIPGPYGYIALIIAWLLGIPTCVGFHTDYARVVSTYWNRVLAYPVMGVLHLAHWIFFRLGRMAVTLNNDMMNDARRAGATRIRLVGTPIRKGFLDEPLAPPTSVETFLALGRLAPEKNFTTYLAAAKNYPDCQFRIAGDGPQRKLVEDAASKQANVEYLGWLERSRVRETLDASDVLVLPSLVEGFGTVIVEAMARQRLVIASANCNIDDWKAVTESVCRIQRGERLEEAIDRLRAEDTETLVTRAKKGRAAALAMNERALIDWFKVFETLAPEKTRTAIRRRKAA